MGEMELKHVIALLLEDAKRVQQLEPNSGTEARIMLAKESLKGTIRSAYMRDAEVTKVTL